MKLTELIRGLKNIEIKGDISHIEVKSLCQNISKLEMGGLLFCYKGVEFDTHNYINCDVESKACALIVEKWVKTPLPQVLVKNTRKIMPDLCNLFYGNVLKKLKFIGVTGTNGKTTTSNIIYNILRSADYSVGLIGTNGIFYNAKKLDCDLTTPDSVDLFKSFNSMVNSGIEWVVMEVSAHSVALNKIHGIKFEVGIFTNLSHDHLDYFGSMGRYAKCKLKFLQKNYCKNVIINTDDRYGEMFAKVSNSNILTYGIDKPCQHFAMDLRLNLDHSCFLVNVFDEIFDIKSNLICKFNVYNILASIVACKLLEVDNNSIYKTITNIKQIDGRMNFYRLNNNAKAIIDFAHTPDSLEKVLINLKKISNSKVILVFGCGGNRDRLKRSRMGQVASLYADEIILTNDNPRNENPSKIIENIKSGIYTNNYIVELDRKKAIELAVSKSQPNDIILIAGKGAENYQEIENKKVSFNDLDCIRKFIFNIDK